jgi:hypothetical protein
MNVAITSARSALNVFPISLRLSVECLVAKTA